MKKSILLLASILFFLAATSGYAQFREDQIRSSDITGNVIKDRPTGTFENLFNMQMSHSYSMMFGSYGGQYQNINAYTNTMQFFFTDRLTGRLDVSLLHSPFGNNFANGGNTGMGAEIILRNAELNYKFNENSSLHIQFQQVPAFGRNPWSPFYRNPFGGFNY